MMRFSLFAASAALAFITTAAFAGPQSAPAAASSASAKTLSSSQQKMSDCSHAAKGKTGADYKSAVSACMKGKSSEAAAPAAATADTGAKQTPQERMKSCNADAKTKALTGAARKTFMSTCLKGDAAAAPATH
jgi:hypothetical protein